MKSMARVEINRYGVRLFDRSGKQVWPHDADLEKRQEAIVARLATVEAKVKR